jgi:hypothetical protein
VKLTSLRCLACGACQAGAPGGRFGSLDLANRHAACIEAQNLVVESVEPRLPLGDQLRFETAGPIARHRNLDLAILGQNRLRTRPVAAVAFAAACRIALLVAEMVGQLRPERSLDQRDGRSAPPRAV